MRELKGIVAVLADADPEDKRAIPDELASTSRTTTADGYTSVQERVY